MHGHIRHLPLDPQVPHSHVAVLWHAGAGTPMHTQATLGSEPHRQQHNTQRLHQLREYVLPMAVGVAGGGDGDEPAQLTCAPLRNTLCSSSA